jgi:hypothetical protein
MEINNMYSDANKQPHTPIFTLKKKIPRFLKQERKEKKFRFDQAHTQKSWDPTPQTYSEITRSLP